MDKTDERLVAALRHDARASLSETNVRSNFCQAGPLGPALFFCAAHVFWSRTYFDQKIPKSDQDQIVLSARAVLSG